MNRLYCVAASKLYHHGRIRHAVGRLFNQNLDIIISSGKYKGKFHQIGYALKFTSVGNMELFSLYHTF